MALQFTWFGVRKSLNTEQKAQAADAFGAEGAYSCLGATEQTLPLFGSIVLVVTFNCLVIAARDASSDRANDPGGASQWWQTMNRDLLWIGVALTLTALFAANLVGATAFYLSLAAAFAALTVLHRYACRLSGDALRSLADFALFTPIPVIGVMYWRGASLNERSSVTPPTACFAKSSSSPAESRSGPRSTGAGDGAG
ncbi:MAG TPA: hypothetical protein VMP01_18505 [Pirellulaceae bacterium]|nr:hypothetical protein [Pirellulaceae bacterium]